MSPNFILSCLKVIYKKFSAIVQNKHTPSRCLLKRIKLLLCVKPSHLFFFLFFPTQRLLLKFNTDIHVSSQVPIIEELQALQIPLFSSSTSTLSKWELQKEWILQDIAIIKTEVTQPTKQKGIETKSQFYRFHPRVNLVPSKPKLK